MLSREWLSAFVPVGAIREQGGFIAAGAGVLLHSPPLLWLVTAAHVVHSLTGAKAAALAPRLPSGIVVIDFSQAEKRFGVQWIYDEAHDLAAIPFPMSPEMATKAVGQENCLPLEKVLPSMATYTVGCPYGVPGVDPGKVAPLVLGGIVAGVNSSSAQIYTSAPTFPGNSGGPLLVVRPPYSPQGTLSVGQATVFLAGIMREMTLVRSGPEAIPSMHLGIATGIDEVWTLLTGKSASDQARRLQAPQAEGSTS